ncbi:MAG TPA: BlaI/MecI/CopY family transcriptional regulator [Bacteroidales bacterium]|nr:BlaI/MecI/CopY family transcriptional regulator [Bacteroidales bacterium]HOX78391.1 BlaI/MecI/CopY family transcriptional regulator [Bacteroidales bacterium]HPM91812.1 BlaI/MecI/CopY family transcriptional regulator [Bacteroidales bacterium]
MKNTPKKFKPTETELEILSILWNKGPATVRDVNDEMSRSKPTGYTTTLKLMQIMAEKGLVEREMDGRSHIYHALARQEDAQVSMLDRLLETAFGGSASKLVMQTLGNHKTTESELKEIKLLIKKLEEEK